MQYRAFLAADYTGMVAGEWQKLVGSLLLTGWKYSETSSLFIDTDDLTPVWRGIELVAKQSGLCGILSSLTFFIQGAGDFQTGDTYAAAKNYGKATVDAIRARPFP